MSVAGSKARAKERFEGEMAEHRAKLAARDEKSGKKPGGRAGGTLLDAINAVWG
jgi:hypothetical protein